MCDKLTTASGPSSIPAGGMANDSQRVDPVTMDVGAVPRRVESNTAEIDGLRRQVRAQDIEIGKLRQAVRVLAASQAAGATAEALLDG